MWGSNLKKDPHPHYADSHPIDRKLARKKQLDPNPLSLVCLLKFSNGVLQKPRVETRFVVWRRNTKLNLDVGLLHAFKVSSATGQTNDACLRLVQLVLRLETGLVHGE